MLKDWLITQNTRENDLFFVRFLELKNKQKMFQNFIVGVNSSVFDDEKSNKSNLEVIRPSCVALFAILEQLQEQTF